MDVKRLLIILILSANNILNCAESNINGIISNLNSIDESLSSKTPEQIESLKIQFTNLEDAYWKFVNSSLSKAYTHLLNDKGGYKDIVGKAISEIKSKLSDLKSAKAKKGREYRPAVLAKVNALGKKNEDQINDAKKISDQMPNLAKIIIYFPEAEKIAEDLGNIFLVIPENQRAELEEETKKIDDSFIAAADAAIATLTPAELKNLNDFVYLNELKKIG